MHPVTIISKDIKVWTSRPVREATAEDGRFPGQEARRLVSSPASGTHSITRGGSPLPTPGLRPRVPVQGLLRGLEGGTASREGCLHPCWEGQDPRGQWT